VQWFFSKNGELDNIYLVSNHSAHFIHEVHYSNQGFYYCYGRDYDTNDYSIASVKLVVYG